MMKTISKSVTIILLMAAALNAAGQGYNLQFNRVIDTSLAVSVTVCTDITASGISSTSVSVPAGKVWKIESIGPLEYYGSSYLYNSCSFNSSTSNNTIWALCMDDGTRSTLKRYAYLLSGSYGEQAANMPVWLRAGTSLYVNISPRNTGYRFTDGSQTSVKTSLSIIEFNLNTP
jgi:hypothetical protein